MNFLRIKLTLNRFFYLFLLFITLRTSIAFVAFFIGQASSFRIPIGDFFFPQLWQIGESLLFFLIFYSLSKLQFAKYFSKILLLIFITFLSLWSIADPIVVALAGDHLTPSLLAHFAGPRIFLSPELYLPILDNLLLVIPGLLLMAAFVRVIYVLVKRAFDDKRALSLKFRFSALAFSAILMVVSYSRQGGYLSYPPEVTFIRNALEWDFLEASEADILRLKNFLKIEIESDHNTAYPLMKTIGSSKIQTKPNIILLVIESLRAQDSKLFNPSAGKLEMESFNLFAEQGLVFPYLISNGFPSSEGFLSLAMGVWPHAKERVILSHQDKNMPSIACSVKDLGYETYRVEDFLDMEEEGPYVRSTFDHHITYEDLFRHPSERRPASAKNMVNSVIDILRSSTEDSAPVYVHLKTRNPHYPYEIHDEENDRFYQIGKPSENYYESLRVIDRHFVRLYEALEDLDLMSNTIVIITGDHANYLDKAHSTSLPTDDTAWTGAIISGPESILGEPQVIEEHGSLVDIPTTVMNLAGGDHSWIGIGRNLLERDTANQAYALAVRPAGLRLDYRGYTHLVDRNSPSDYISFPAFNGIATNRDSTPLVSSFELLTLIDTWTYLVESNKVYPKNVCVD